MPTRDGVKEVAADMIVPGAVAGDLIVAPSPISLAGIHDVPIGSVLCSGGINLIPGWSSAPMVGGLLNLGSTPTLGLNNANTSPALVGARVQAGPIVASSGSAWETTGGSSKVVSAGLMSLPLTGADAAAHLGLMTKVGSGAWAEVASAEGGYWYANGLSANSLGVYSAMNGIGAAFTPAVLAQNHTSALIGTQVQYGPALASYGSVWDGGLGAAVEADVGFCAKPVIGSPATLKMSFQTKLGGAAWTEQAYLNTGGEFHVGNVYALGRYDVTFYNTLTNVIPGYYAVAGTLTTAIAPVQNSPAYQLSARVWNTTGIGADEVDNIYLVNVPVSGLVPYPTLSIQNDCGGGATGEIFYAADDQSAAVYWAASNTARRFCLRSNLAFATADDAFRMWAYNGTKSAGNLWALGDGVTYTEKVRFSNLGALTISGVNNIGTPAIPATGISLYNATAALVGTRQNSPAIIQNGASWNSTGGAPVPFQFAAFAKASNLTVDFWQYCWQNKLAGDAAWHNSMMLEHTGGDAARSTVLVIDANTTAYADFRIGVTGTESSKALFGMLSATQMGILARSGILCTFQSGLVAADAGTDFLLHSTPTRTNGLLFDLQNNTTSVLKSDFNGVLTMTDIRAAGLGVVATPGFTLTNPVPATGAATVQYGPMVVSSGTAWDTVSASVTCQVGMMCVPVSAATPVGSISWQLKNGAGAWFQRASLTSSGSFSADGSLNVTGVIGIGYTATDGFFQQSTTNRRWYALSNRDKDVADDAFRFYAQHGTRTAGNLLAIGDGAAYAEKVKFDYLGALTISGVNNLLLVPTPGITVSNATPAVSPGATIQYGPIIASSGTAYDTGTTLSVTEQVGFWSQPNSANPSSVTMVFGRKHGAGAWTYRATIDNDGNFAAVGNIQGSAVYTSIGSIACLNATTTLAIASNRLFSDNADAVRISCYNGTRTAGNLLAIGDGAVFVEKAAFNYLGALTISGVNNIGPTPTVAMLAQNATPATAVVPVQYGPMVVSSGTMWDGAATVTLQGGMMLVPTTAATQALLKFYTKVGVGAWTEQGSFTSYGALLVNQGAGDIYCDRFMGRTTASLRICGNLAAADAGNDIKLYSFNTRTNGNLFIVANGTAGPTTLAQDFNGVITMTDIRAAGLVTTPTAGLTLTNPVAATAGVTVQYGPMVVSSGTAWQTAVGGTSETMQAAMLCVPVTGATATARMSFQTKTGAAAWAEQFYIKGSDGHLYTTLGMRVAQSSGFAASDGSYTFARNGAVTYFQSGLDANMMRIDSNRNKDAADDAFRFWNYAGTRTAGNLLALGDGAVYAQKWAVDWAGRTLTSDGAVANCGYGFINEPGMGMYRVGAASMSICANGYGYLRLFSGGVYSYGPLYAVSSVYSNVYASYSGADKTTISGGYNLVDVGLELTCYLGTMGKIAGGTQTQILADVTFNPASGATKFIGMNINPTINQTAGCTGDYTALQVNAVETSALGTNKLLLDLQTGTATRFWVNSDGRLTQTIPSAAGYAAGVEVIGCYHNLAGTRTWATGAITLQREVVIAAPTYAFVGASTITTAVTFDITDAPIVGANCAITNRLALRVGGITQHTSGVVFAHRLVNDAVATITNADYYVFYSAISTARAANLPLASTCLKGQTIEVGDASGSCTAGKEINVTPNGADTINGVASLVAINASHNKLVLVSDGVSNWEVG